MSKHLRELTRKGDPLLKVKLPVLVHEMVQSSAKANRRKIQDEMIKRLAASFKNEASSQMLQQDLIKQLKPTNERT